MDLLTREDLLPDISVLAARAITHIAEISPPSGGIIIKNKGAKAFVEKMLNPQFIDFAEQSLQVRTSQRFLISMNLSLSMLMPFFCLPEVQLLKELTYLVPYKGRV